MKWFNNPKTLEALKKQYKELVFKHHPDVGGSDEQMKEINNEYDFRFERLKNIHENAEGQAYTAKDESTEMPNDFKSIILNLISLTQKHVEFISLKENVDTTTPQGKFMLTVFAAMAELERESILQRQKEGIAEAKKNGKYHGRPKSDFDLEKLKKVCSRWRSGEITATAAMQQINMKPNTFYRRVKENNL